MPFRVKVEGYDETFTCADDQTVLRCTEVGIKRRIPVGCRQGGCGVCKVEVLSGTFTARVMSRAHVSVDDQAAGRVLSCCIWPTSDLTVRVLGQMKRVPVKKV
jgi:ferredoxin